MDGAPCSLACRAAEGGKGAPACPAPLMSASARAWHSRAGGWLAPCRNVKLLLSELLGCNAELTGQFSGISGCRRRSTCPPAIVDTATPGRWPFQTVYWDRGAARLAGTVTALGPGSVQCAWQGAGIAACPCTDHDAHEAARCCCRHRLLTLLCSLILPPLRLTTPGCASPAYPRRPRLPPMAHKGWWTTLPVTPPTCGCSTRAPSRGPARRPCPRCWRGGGSWASRWWWRAACRRATSGSRSSTDSACWVRGWAGGWEARRERG